MTVSDDGRLANTTACLPLCYGSVAFHLGKDSDEFRTHRWTLYVRSPDPGFDLGRAISKVVFQLHASFAQPTRELRAPPFEVTETGWGEFEASMRVVWRKEADERSIMLTHMIKLYPNKAPATSTDPSAHMDPIVPVVSEKYDEVVFTNPKEGFHQSLMAGHTSKKLPYPLSNEPSVLQHLRTYGDEGDVKAMLEAKQFLEGELRNVKDRMFRVDAELEEVKRSLTAAVVPEGTAGEGNAGPRGTSRGNSGKGKAKNKMKKKASASASNTAGKKAKKMS